MQQIVGVDPDDGQPLALAPWPDARGELVVSRAGIYADPNGALVVMASHLRRTDRS
jgi:hypothetical protein